MVLSRWRLGGSAGDEPVPLIIRLGVAGVVLWNLGQVGRLAYLALVEAMPDAFWWLMGAFALALVAEVVLIVAAVRGVWLRRTGWLLAVVTLAVTALLPFGSYEWTMMLSMPAAMALIYFRPPVNIVLFVLLTVLVPVSVALMSRPPAASGPLYIGIKIQYGSVDTMDVMWIGVALAVLVWLTRTVRELDSARRQLAARAVIIERQRIDDEVARTLGAALDQIVARGELAQTLAEATPDLSAMELRELTTRSRDALAQARAMLSGYRDVSAEAELRAAVTLLAAAGIHASLALDAAGKLPAELPETARAMLREAVAGALEDRELGGCVLTATTADGELVIELVRPADRACCEDAA
jgi:two-component system, NarL family, sensor histidine kinase DesK